MAGNSKKLNLTNNDIQQAFAASDWAVRFPPLLTVDQAAALVQVPKATIYDWSSRGLLQGCGRRVGKHLRLWRDKLLLKIFNEGLDPDAQ
jgi:excisionase family DNA binding protein